MLALLPTSVCAARRAVVKSPAPGHGREVCESVSGAVLERRDQAAREHRVTGRDLVKARNRNFAAARHRAFKRRADDVPAGARAHRGRIALEHRFETVALDRLRNHFVHAGGAAGPDLCLQGARCESDDGIRAPPDVLADAPGSLEPVHHGHLHVHEHEVDAAFLEDGERLGAIDREYDLATGAFQE
jgi:hypothetical protein